MLDVLRSYLRDAGYPRHDAIVSNAGRIIESMDPHQPNDEGASNSDSDEDPYDIEDSD